MDHVFRRQKLVRAFLDKLGIESAWRRFVTKNTLFSFKIFSLKSPPNFNTSWPWE